MQMMGTMMKCVHFNRLCFRTQEHKHFVCSRWLRSTGRFLPPKQKILHSRHFKTVAGAPPSTPKSWHIIKNFVFTCAVGTCSFAVCMKWKHDNDEALLWGFSQKPLFDNRLYDNSSSDFKLFNFRRQISRWWNSQSKEQKYQYGLVAANVAIFLLWKVAPSIPMIRYFTSVATVNPLISNVLSSFSHNSFLHIFFNMNVLLSFAPVVIFHLGLEQASAMYLTAGVVSAFTGNLNKIIQSSKIPSLGASGAILGFVGYICTVRPNAELNVLFLDGIIPRFSAEQGLYGIIALDTLGLIFRWKLFDHAGHLGGVLFGVLYAKYGEKMIWEKRHRLDQLWRKMSKSD